MMEEEWNLYIEINQFQTSTKTTKNRLKMIKFDLQFQSQSCLDKLIGSIYKFY